MDHHAWARSLCISSIKHFHSTQEEKNQSAESLADSPRNCQISNSNLADASAEKSHSCYSSFFFFFSQTVSCYSIPCFPCLWSACASPSSSGPCCFWYPIVLCSIGDVKDEIAVYKTQDPERQRSSESAREIKSTNTHINWVRGAKVSSGMNGVRSESPDIHSPLIYWSSQEDLHQKSLKIY